MEIWEKKRVFHDVGSNVSISFFFLLWIADWKLNWTRMDGLIYSFWLLELNILNVMAFYVIIFQGLQANSKFNLFTLFKLPDFTHVVNIYICFLVLLWKFFQPMSNAV